jgi:hypothetical protein
MNSNISTKSKKARLEENSHYLASVTTNVAGGYSFSVGSYLKAGGAPTIADKVTALAKLRANHTIAGRVSSVGQSRRKRHAATGAERR